MGRRLAALRLLFPALTALAALVLPGFPASASGVPHLRRATYNDLRRVAPLSLALWLSWAWKAAMR